MERLLAAGASVDAVDNDGRGLGAGRVVVILASETSHAHIAFPGCEHPLKLIENGVACGKKRKANIVFA